MGCRQEEASLRAEQDWRIYDTIKRQEWPDQRPVHCGGLFWPGMEGLSDSNELRRMRILEDAHQCQYKAQWDHQRSFVCARRLDAECQVGTRTKLYSTVL